MKLLKNVFDRYRPLFEGRRAKLGVFKTLFETAEFIFFYPSDRAAHAPFVRDPIEIKRYMGIVILSMLPCALSSIYFFGPYVIAMILTSYIVGGICEVAFALVRKGEIHEGFLVTGLIFPLVLPPTTPLWIVAVGVAFGVIFGKEVFGGTGKNMFNPALVGRLFVTIAFPSILTTHWKLPADIFGMFTNLGLTPSVPDAVSAATPMALFKTQQVVTPLTDLLWGNTAGSSGETFHIGIILGGLFLMITRVSNWRLPVSYIAAAFIFGLIGHSINSEAVAPAGFQVLSGGLLFGAMFMMTDPVTAPVTKSGKFIVGTLAGLLTVLIRSFSSYVEGVMFSIVIMNAFTPLIDHLVLKVKFRQVAV
jgi:Na+-transporting NADH:ubiquinone oxidoreductase subunit B